MLIGEAGCGTDIGEVKLALELTNRTVELAPKVRPIMAGGRIVFFRVFP